MTYCSPAIDSLVETQANGLGRTAIREAEYPCNRQKIARIRLCRHDFGKSIFQSSIVVPERQSGFE